MTTTAKTLIRIHGVESIALADGYFNLTHSIEQGDTWPDGEDAGEIEAIWSDTRTIVAAASEDLDLFDLDQLDALGNTVQTVSFKAIKAIYIVITSASPGVLTIGGGSTGAGAADAWAGAGTPFVTDGTLRTLAASSAGYSCDVWQNQDGGNVADVTSHILHMAAAGANVTYSIVIIGEKP